MGPAGPRRSLGALFVVLAAMFAGIAIAAASADAGAGRWVIAAASGVLAAWMGGLALRALGVRR